MKIYRVILLSAIITCTILANLSCSHVSAAKSADAEFSSWVKMPRIYSDNMVLQRDREITFTGKAEPLKKIKISIGDNEAVATANENGSWELKLPAMKAGGPYFVTVISDKAPIKMFENVMIGEVWFCSGQSNMAMKVQDVKDGPSEVKAAKYPNMRLFQSPNTMSAFEIKDDLPSGSWQPCSPETVEDFSAVGYFFGRRLYTDLDIPIGLIHSSWGGTPIEAWIPYAGYVKGDQKDILDYIEKYRAESKIPKPSYEDISEEWWNGIVKKHEEEIRASDTWYEPQLDDSDWKTIDAPPYWENNGLQVNGLVWMRKHINIPQEWEGKDLMVHLGMVDDCDTTYFDAHIIGSTGNEIKSPWAHFRKYKIPGNLVKAGSRILAVRVVDHAHGGGLGSKPNLVFIDLPERTLDKKDPGSANRISLAGEWKYKIAYALSNKEMRPPAVKDETYFQFPTTLYNAMVAPWTVYPIQGVIWYQGENNTVHPESYAALAKLQIESWRRAWDNPDMFFLTTQLSSYRKPTDNPNAKSNWALLREAQNTTLKLKNTGVAVTVDLGDAQDIHPKRKQEVGDRLARIALNKAYGQSNVICTGPVFTSMDINGDTVRVHFDANLNKLSVKGDGPLKGFAIAGADKVYHWANAKLDGETVVLTCNQVKEPRYVKYGWADYSEGNLYDTTGLPASPFRADFEKSEQALLKKSGIIAEDDLRVKMRDGADLSTNVYRPAKEGKYPVVLRRTPYDAIVKGSAAPEWPSRGFVYVSQDVRGKFRSQNHKGRGMKGEISDGEDTLDWIVKQPWCNGSITMYGGSYLGMTQLAAAMTGHEALTSITPCLIPNKFYHRRYWGGAYRLSNRETELPLATQNAFEKDPDVYAHPLYDDYWKSFSISEAYDKVKAPTFIRTGWFDLFFCDVFDLFNGIRQNGGSEKARKYTRIIVGPWPHNINQQKTGEVDFGPEGVIKDLYGQEIEFMQYFTAGKEGYDLDTAPIRIFVMGTNKWRDEYEWPLARTVWTDYFLSSGGNANTAAGDGVLGTDPSGDSDTYSYDPSNPVPTKGGSWGFNLVGPCDQTDIEKRQDVLVYTSKACKENTEVTGPVEVRLFAASSATDTDFTAKLVDVQPDGKAMSITDGIVRARYRNGKDELIKPGEVIEYVIQCCPTSYTFLKGHKIRLEISSSNYPAFVPNLNTGEHFAAATKMEVAQQTIYHSEKYPSRIILPVIFNK